MPQRRRYSCIAHFPWGLPMTVGDLGLVKKVRIGTRTVIMAFPVLNGDGTLSAPLSCGRQLPLRLAEKFDGRWGSLEADRCYVAAASASILLHPEEVVAGSAEFLVLREAFFGWCRTVQEWAAAWSGEPLRDFDSSRDVALHIPLGDTVLIASPPRGRTVIGGTVPLHRDQVIAAFDHASRGQRLPTEHRMLLAARDAELGGDLRKAVIDAATAAEVALSLYVRDHLRAKGVQSALRDEWMSGVNGLTQLYRLCKKLGGTPGIGQDPLSKGLAAARNRAVHGGNNPTRDEVAVAIRQAKTIVRALRSLPEN